MKVTKLERVLNAPKAFEGGTSKRSCSAIVDGDNILVTVEGSTVWREKKQGETYESQTDAGLSGTLVFTLQQAANLLVGKFLTDIEGSSLEEGSVLEVPQTYGLVGEKTEKVKGMKVDTFLLQAMHEVKTHLKNGDAITLDNLKQVIEAVEAVAPETAKAIKSKARALRSANKAVAQAELDI